MGFWFLLKSVTLNDLERHNGRYLRHSTKFGNLGANYVKVVKDRPMLCAAIKM